MPFVIYYFNNIKKHEEFHHEKHIEFLRKYLQIYDSGIWLENDEKIVIDSDKERRNRNIYILTMKCQAQLGNSFAIDKMMKPYKVSVIIHPLESHLINALGLKLHRDDILIVNDLYQDKIDIPVDVRLDELSERLINDESLYYTFGNRRGGHQLNEKGMKLVTDALKSVIEKIPEPENPDPHLRITNLDCRYAMEQYINDVKLPLYVNFCNQVLLDRTVKNGFIEMNCNPMTIGHVFLIKTALKFMEKNSPEGKLFILVVQKDSQGNFTVPFKTRFEIISKVCSRISEKIIVVPNRNVLIGDVFIGYQKADKNTQESYQGGTNAMNLFAHFLAPMLNVGFRFFGTEEGDVTTNRYNEDAKEICPKQNIKVCIVKRLKTIR